MYLIDDEVRREAEARKEVQDGDPPGVKQGHSQHLELQTNNITQQTIVKNILVTSMTTISAASAPLFQWRVHNIYNTPKKGARRTKFLTIPKYVHVSLWSAHSVPGYTLRIVCPP